MNRTFKKAVVSTVLLSVTGFSVAAGCPAVVDSAWQAGLTAAQSSIAIAVQGMAQGISVARALNLERIMGSIRVLNAQISATSNKSSQMNLSAKQASANVAVEISNRKAVMQAIADYSPQTGQGFDPCGEEQRSKNIAIALGEAANDMQEKVVRELDSAPGRFVADPSTVVAQRMQLAKSTYCTADEARAGLCSTPGAMAGKDVDGANFFTSAQVGSDSDNAKSALLNNMFGTPDIALNKNTAALPAGQAYMEQKRNKDAVASVAQSSLKTIQGWTSSRGGSGSDTQSVLDALSSKIGTYSGGENYDAWAQTLASQSQRGLLVSFSKMLATDLYVTYLNYQSGEREEAIAAARLALHASDMPTGDAALQNAAARPKVAQ
ncbi:hypothetical protein [Burkholderia sp. Tr-20390]|uniref:hypothetical protein n=1 Tax=Burkholderia sp. Tr-20390 TaxID=2703904 RepID=UPI00197FA211|nr:hypothetical protein [Burkholderia sp. Tr-20390]MBN3729402.1 hypothetical protein [Burkholderia sp. Tr-20390]